MKKRIIKRGIWLLAGFILGIVYSNLFIYSGLIRKAQTSEKVVMVQSIEEVEEVVEEPVCEYDEVTCKIKEVAEEYNVDWKLAVAISKHETGRYTSAAFHKNNVGGNFGYQDGTYKLMSFDSLENGIRYFVNNLKVKYFDLGLDTIETIQPKYAPVGADNDPNGLNTYWVSGVKKYYSELEVR